MGPQHHIDSGTEQPSQLIADVRDVYCVLDQLDARLSELLPTHRSGKALPRDWQAIAARLRILARRIEGAH